MNSLFETVYLLLCWLSDITGLSYKSINAIIYFILIPFIFICLIDRIIKKHYLKIIFTILIIFLVLTIKDYERFAIGIFDLSVKFLNWFKIIGWNYTVASVIICVFVPVILFIVLFYFAFRAKIKQIYDRL